MSSLAAILPTDARLALPDLAADDARRGCARLKFAGESPCRLVSARAHSPLRVLQPKNHGRGAWAYLSTLGGGLLGGDEIHVEIEAGAGSLAFVGTQSSTKVFRSGDGRVTRQSLEARVSERALLLLLPDPVACFAEARYRQRQRVELHKDGSIALLDWLTSGRHARGERWAFAECSSGNEVWRDGTCVLRDRIHLPRVGRSLGMDTFNCLATLILTGPRVAGAAAAVLAELGSAPVVPGAATAFGVSPLGDGLILRVAGPDAEAVGRFIFPRLEFLAEILGDCPWRRKW